MKFINYVKRNNYELHNTEMKKKIVSAMLFKPRPLAGNRRSRLLLRAAFRSEFSVVSRSRFHTDKFWFGKVEKKCSQMKWRAQIIFNFFGCCQLLQSKCCRKRRWQQNSSRSRLVSQVAILQEVL